MQLSEQELIRRKARKDLMDMNIDPYPPELFEITTTSREIKEKFKAESALFKNISIEGRIMSRRIMGSASFAEIQDDAGRIQIYLRRDDICTGEDKSVYNDVFKKKLDIGDIVGIKGFIFVTQVGEISIHVTSFKILTKSLRPLPIVKEREDDEGNKKTWDAFTDPEQRYRQRYLDLIVNPEIKDTFRKRALLVNTIRNFLNKKGYVEVETPILQPIPGGASARPFMTHHNALDIPLYLRVANELYLKRLIVGGFDGVYEFSKDFRNEGMDRTHNPEFTVMELYVAYKDYFWMMETTETLLEKVATEATGNAMVTVGNHRIDFKAPYPRVPILEAIHTHTGIDVSEMNEEQLRETARGLGLEVDDRMGEGKLIDEIFGEKCEHHYIQPTFIIDYPKSMSPLTKAHRSNPKLTERFELMVNGKE